MEHISNCTSLETSCFYLSDDEEPRVEQSYLTLEQNVLICISVQYKRATLYVSEYVSLYIVIDKKIRRLH